MSTVIRLMNVTPKKLRVLFEGAPISFEPTGQAGSIMDLPKEAADYVKGHLLDQVQVLEAGSRARSLVVKTKEVSYWLANMSGDPDAPEYLEETFNDPRTGELKNKLVRNPLKTPFVFKARLGTYNGLVPPGTLKFKGNNGEMTTNMRDAQVTFPGKIVEIRPYERVEVTRGQFETLIRRDADRPKGYPPTLIPSRSPGDFEPDINDDFWSIDRLRLWLEMVPATEDKPGGNEVMGKSEAELVAENAALNPTQLAILLHKTRFELWARAIHRVMDPQFEIPSENDFRAAVARKAKADKKAPAETSVR